MLCSANKGTPEKRQGPVPPLPHGPTPLSVLVLISFNRVGAGLKVGWMTRTIWVTFLEGQVGLICKLNYLDVTRISHVH